jgi:hypothetical protein
MKPRLLSLILLALVVLEGVAPFRAHAGPTAILLSSEAEVHGDTILLAHLMPGDASRQLRQIAEKVSLGGSPQVGSTRRIMRSVVLKRIQASGMSTAAFEVPEVIDVRRASRKVTRDEVLSAIQSSFVKGQVSGLLKPEDVRFDASIAVPDDGVAQLRVTNFTFDSLLGRGRFRLSSTAMPGGLSFVVTVDARDGQSGERAGAAPSPSESISTAMVVLVDPRRTAQLRLHSENSETVLKVQPLLSGHFGETIPVRLLKNRKTLRARVVGADFLDASF